MKNWNFGIVGAGMIADFHAKAIGDVSGGKLTAVFDLKKELADQLAAKYSCRAYSDLNEMLNSSDVDIVTIATPSGAHLEPVLAAAEAEKHVICEKPLEISLERIDWMIEAHEKTGTLLGGVFQNRFNEVVAQIKKTIDSGRLGRITYASVHVPWWRKEEYYKDSWHGTWKLDGGGALMNQSIHMIDLICYLMPQPLQSVHCFAETLGHENMEAEDTAVVNLRFADRSLGFIYGTTASFPGHLRRTEITGTKGTITCVEDRIDVWDFSDKQPEDEEIRRRFSTAETRGGSADPAAIPYHNHTRNFKAFTEALESGERLCLDGREARKAVQVILAAYDSAREGRVIELKH